MAAARRRKKVKFVDPEIAATTLAKAKDIRAKAVAAREKEKKEAEELLAQAKAIGKKAKRQKQLCGFLIIFCLRHHGCSAKRILTVLRSYAIESTEKSVTRCIKRNKLITLHKVLPHDEGERSAFKIDETVGLTMERLHSKHIKLTMTHPELPAIFSAGLVLTHAPEGRHITTTAFKNHIVFDIFSLADPSSLTVFFMHTIRCLQRALGSKFPQAAFQALPKEFRYAVQEQAKAKARLTR